MIVGFKELSLVMATITHSGEALPEQDVICMARNIYFEARSESVDGQYAVAHVTMNRVRSPRFPDSVCDVVTQDLGPKPWDCQFSWFCDGKSDTPRNQKAYKQALDVAIDVMSGSEDTTSGALYYTTRKARERVAWAKKLPVALTIGDHVFMLERAG